MPRTQTHPDRRTLADCWKRVLLLEQQLDSSRREAAALVLKEKVDELARRIAALEAHVGLR
jgi:hypothetical protein